MTSLELNTAASKEAEAVLSLANLPQPARFYERLVELCGGVMPKPEQRKTLNDDPYPPLNDLQIKDFEKSTVPPGYGKYGGKNVIGVPPRYWANITDDDPFTITVKRYVKTKRFKRRLQQDYDNEDED